MEKEDSMELSQIPWTQTTDKAPKPWLTIFFPLWKLKGNQPAPKAPIMHLMHFEEEGTRRDEDKGSDDLDGIKRVTEEFMVCLVRAVKCPNRGEALLSL